MLHLNMPMLNRFIFILGLGFLLTNCSMEDNLHPYPCIDGDCNTIFEIDNLVTPDLYLDENNYWHITHPGFNYFTIKGELDELEDDYVVNGVPLIETAYDSNYWIAFDSLTFTVPTYSVLSWFTDNEFNTPLPVGTYTYTLTDIVQIMSPLNIAGYTISKYFDFNHPAAETMLGSYSKYNYIPRQQFYFGREMIGDTATVFIKTTFNNDFGPSVEVEKEFNIIFE